MKIINHVFLLSVVLQAFFSPASAISEQDYRAEYQASVVPFVAAHETLGELAGKEGVVLHYAAFANEKSKALIVISAGYTEFFYKYEEVAYDLYRAGFSVYIMDHRGQGSSKHLLSDSKLAYIDRFDYFVDDLKSFVDQVVMPSTGGVQPLFLLGHSMGGAIAAQYLEKYPNDFKAAALLEPMLKIQLGSYPAEKKLALQTLVYLGLGSKVAVGRPRSDPTLQSFESNSVTHSADRFEMTNTIIRLHPEVRLDAPTNAWVLRAIEGGESAIANKSLIKTPLFLIQAGEDAYVENQAEQDFCSAVSTCTFSVIPGARHELLMEKDIFREQALSKLIDFFKAVRN